MCVAQFPNKWLSLADCIDCLFCCQDGLRPSFVYPTSGMIQNILLFPTFFNLTNVNLNIYEVYFIQLNLELRSWDLCLIIVLAITFPKYLEFAAVGNILFYLCSKSSSLQLSLELGNALTVDKRLIALYCSVRRRVMVSSRQQHAEGRHTHNRGNEQNVLSKEDWSCPRGKLSYFWCFWQTSLCKRLFRSSFSQKILFV